MENDIRTERIIFETLWQDTREVLAHELAAFKGEIETDFYLTPAINYGKVHALSILRNLISNAVKYSESCPNPKITISTSKQEDYILLKVKDNGIGIDMKKARNQLFKPFTRLTNKAGGTGMGLYIIKNIIEKNGGYIRIESEPDQGTTFYCYLREYHKGI